MCAAVLSGNRNFEARIHPNLKANFLASPPLVVAYAIAGNVMRDLMTEPVGKGKGGKDVYLGDIWPTQRRDRRQLMKHAMNAKAFRENYEQGQGRPGQAVEQHQGRRRARSTTGRSPPTSPSRRSSMASRWSRTAARRGRQGRAHHGAVRRLDHHRPHLAGRLDQGKLAGRQVAAWSNGVPKADFNSYGSRRGNHEVMMRGTFANVRIKNLMIPAGAGRLARGRRRHAASSPAARRCPSTTRR